MYRKISVVIPAYNEADSIVELYKKIMEQIHRMLEEAIISDYEIWYINDGSTDNTEQRIIELNDVDQKVHLISFRRNFGKAKALDAAFHHVDGDIVFTMDADLQDDPAEFRRFINKMDKDGDDLVVGWKYTRLDSMEKKLPSKLFNKVTSIASGINLHDFDCGFKAFRKEVVKSIDIYGELHRYIPVLAHRKGFQISEITVKHHKRKYGKSKYGMERYLRGLFDSFTTTFLLKYSDRPMYFFGRVGLLFILIGVALNLYLTILWFMGNSIGNRPLLLLGVLCILVGIQFISTGFIGNLVVEQTHRKLYDENHIKTII